MSAPERELPPSPRRDDPLPVVDAGGGSPHKRTLVHTQGVGPPPLAPRRIPFKVPHMPSTPYCGRRLLELAAAGLACGAAIHIVAWVGGPSWVEALGAPPSIAASTAARTWPALLGTGVIAAMLTGLALCCVLMARLDRDRPQRRWILRIAAVVFVARGLLVVPYALADKREWRTPIGHFVVTGHWFAAESVVVLAIGMLISIGLFRSELEVNADPALVHS